MKMKASLWSTVLVLLLSTLLFPITTLAVTPTLSVFVGEKKPIETVIQLTTLKKEAEGLKVKWVSSDNKIAEMDYSNSIVGKAKGNVTLTGKINDVAVTQINVKVSSNVKGVKVDKPTLALKTGDTNQLMATVIPINPNEYFKDSVKWTSSDPKIVQVYSNGKIRAIGVGKVTITGTTVDGGFKANAVVTVSSGVTGIQAPKELSLNVGEVKELGATITTNSNTSQNISYVVTKKEIAKVDTKGKVTGLKEGSTTVTLKSLDGKYSKTMTIKVISNIDSLAMGNKEGKKMTSLSLKVGEPHQLTAIGSPNSLNGYKIAWTSSDSKIAYIDSRGVVKGLKAGKATITFTLPQELKPLKATITINVVSTVTGVKVNKKTTKINVGAEETLIATVSPSTAYLKDVTWKSSNSGVAMVNSKGVVKGIKAGTATISAITKDGQKVATTTVTVVSLAKGIQVPSTNLKFYMGNTYKFKATVVPDTALVKTISTKLLTKDGSSVVKVTKGKDGEYTLTGLKPGKTQLELKTKDGNFTKVIQIEVLKTPLKVEVYDKNSGKKIN